jgi:hypothetical protein
MYTWMLYIYIYIDVQNVPKIFVNISGVSCLQEREEIRVNVCPQPFSF